MSTSLSTFIIISKGVKYYVDKSSAEKKKTPTRSTAAIDRRRRQVDQLSRTNPRKALHHGKQQYILNSHVTTTTPLLLVICHPVARIDNSLPVYKI